jgi:formylglycine-generating enzyme required for sulfatase activity
MLVRRRAATTLAAVVVSAITIAGQGPPSIDVIMARAGQYVSTFFERFSNVVAEENYVQDTLGNLASVALGGRNSIQVGGRSSHRELKADFLLVKNGAAEWIPFRDVFEVDGSAVRDREQRLQKLFVQAKPDALAQALQIANESSRFNIGAVQRTLNTPTQTLIYLRPDSQDRFKFSLGKRDPAAGDNVWIVDFKETARPTFVHGLRDLDIPSTGRYWIDAGTGRIIRSELELTTQGVRARLTTSFRIDERFQIDVPFEMREQYFLDRSQVTATATYTRFRRFDVNSDESFHNPAATTITDKRTGIVLTEIPSGRFTMGSPRSEIGRRPDETPHDVTLNRAFFLGQHEVTQQEWRALMGNNPSRFSECGPRCPVENVTFADVQRFIATLNAPADNVVVYRLPTEAEWEYACRAGTTTPFATGNTLTTAQANYNGKKPYGDAEPGMSRERPTRAAGFPPNPWALVDMHGNVWEWTADRYGAYPSEDVSDPIGATSGETRVIRGGSWQTEAANTRCAARSTHAPDRRDSDLGFRVAADRKPTQE